MTTPKHNDMCICQKSRWCKEHNRWHRVEVYCGLSFEKSLMGTAYAKKAAKARAKRK